MRVAAVVLPVTLLGVSTAQEADDEIHAIKIRRDASMFSLGAEDDVQLQRTDDGGLRITADVTIAGSLDVETDFLEGTHDWHVFVGEDEIFLKEAVPVTQTFTTAAEYELAFEIMPTGTIANWGSIIHFTASGDNCCNYGDRIPAVWFHQGTTELHMIAGSNSTGNAAFNSEVELPLNEWTEVRFRVTGDSGDVYLNGEYIGSVDTDQRLPHDDVEVWMADPWHDPAQAWLRNVRYQRIAYHHSNFYNEFTVHDVEDSIEDRIEELEDQVASLQDRIDELEGSSSEPSICSRSECCAGNYLWDGDTLYCWAWFYDSYEEDPCGCYAVVHDLGDATYLDHYKNCMSEGTHLMSFHSQNAVNAVGEYGSRFWIGLQEWRGMWGWSDGTALDLEVWDEGEPNDSGGEDCGQTWTSSNSLWNDADCEKEEGTLGICLFTK